MFDGNRYFRRCVCSIVTLSSLSSIYLHGSSHIGASSVGARGCMHPHHFQNGEHFQVCGCTNTKFSALWMYTMCGEHS